MNHFKYILLLVCVSALTMTGCREESTAEHASAQAANQNDDAHHELQNYVNCPEIRPDVCTQIYSPVCGLVDAGIRCITTPCPSVVHKTFGNACTACSDEKVTGYVDGECATANEQYEDQDQQQSNKEQQEDSSAREPESMEED